MGTNQEKMHMNAKDYIHLMTNLHHDNNNEGEHTKMPKETTKKYEEYIKTLGWLKLTEGLFVDMSEKNDHYGELLKQHDQKLHCDLPYLIKKSQNQETKRVHK